MTIPAFPGIRWSRTSREPDPKDLEIPKVTKDPKVTKRREPAAGGASDYGASSGTKVDRYFAAKAAIESCLIAVHS